MLLPVDRLNSDRVQCRPLVSIEGKKAGMEKATDENKDYSHNMCLHKALVWGDDYDCNGRKKHKKEKKKTKKMKKKKMREKERRKEEKKRKQTLGFGVPLW